MMREEDKCLKTYRGCKMQGATCKEAGHACIILVATQKFQRIYGTSLRGFVASLVMK